jgi:glutaredoxin
MRKYALFIIPMLFLFCATVNADFYKWEDESGATHITDYPPPQAESASNIQRHKSSSDKSATDEEREAKLKAEKKPDVTLFTKNDCADCDKAREFLKSKKVIFTEYNMDRDKTAAAKRKELDKDTGDDVPYAIINRNQVFGFTESVYNRALKLNP